MQAKIEEEVKISLTLSRKEAYWLKALMQNPLTMHPDEEPLQDREMRTMFWNALPDLN